MSTYRAEFLCATLLSSVLIGCGGGGVDDYPDMGSVSGTVTMDGKPVVGASVSFQPADPGSRTSFGTTDEDGYYELTYSANMEGAKVGDHTVRISTYKPAGPGPEGDVVAATAETIPNQYNSQSTLKKTVEAGSNELDFELSSEGEIDSHEEADDYEDE